MTAPKLRAFTVEHAEEPERGTELVYALTPQQARRLASGYMDADYTEVRAHRAREHDKRALEFNTPCCEGSARYLRLVGWRVENELSCCGCGRAAMGIEEFGVCRATNMCKECGCDTLRLCGATGIDGGGRCTRCGLLPDNESECPPGFLVDVPPCTHPEGFSCG